MRNHPIGLWSRLSLGLLACVAITAQAADEAAIRASVQGLMPDHPVERIRPTPLAGLNEVLVAGQVIYVSDDGRFVMNGSLIDARERRDLSEITRNEVRARELERLPADVRISFAPQSPAAHKVTVFTAVDCGYCRRFHSQIDDYLKAGIAVDYVLVPLGGPNSTADAASARVYCAADRQKAFTAATFGETFEAELCESNYRQGVDLAARLAITTTPTIVAADGSIVGGFLEPAPLRQKLDAGQAGP